VLPHNSVTKSDTSIVTTTNHLTLLDTFLRHTCQLSLHVNKHLTPIILASAANVDHTNMKHLKFSIFWLNPERNIPWEMCGWHSDERVTKRENLSCWWHRCSLVQLELWPAHQSNAQSLGQTAGLQSAPESLQLSCCCHTEFEVCSTYIRSITSPACNVAS